MKIYIKQLTHLHEGIGPGFPDTEVHDGFKIMHAPTPGYEEVDLIGLSDLEEILLAIKQERVRQDSQWGGPEHDDTHQPRHWLSYILSQCAKSRFSKNRLDLLQYFEERMVKVAALAIAAIQSQRRIHARTNPGYPRL